MASFVIITVQSFKQLRFLIENKGKQHDGKNNNDVQYAAHDISRDEINA